MSFDLKEIASISGMPGLYRIIAPTRNGIIVESLADKPVRSVAQSRNRVSILQEISMYTNDAESTVPLTDLFDRIKQKHGANLPVNAKSSNQELANFLESVLPDYDQERVYASDMKKLVQWYTIVSQFVPETPAAAETTGAPEAEPAEAETPKEAKPKTKKKTEK